MALLASLAFGFLRTFPLGEVIDDGSEGSEVLAPKRTLQGAF